MNFRNGILYLLQTLVVIPLITSRKDIEFDSTTELHYLRNPEPIILALLTDPKDADQETMPEDEDLVKQTIEAIGALNRKYGPVSFSENSAENSEENDSTSVSRFYFLHRKRLWNPSEGKWIGWERKRGKLHELNLLLRGKSGLSFTVFTDGFHDENPDKGILQRTRFVITLDTDTVLPRGAACRLAGTLAHPLNRPIFDEKTGPGYFRIYHIATADGNSSQECELFVVHPNLFGRYRLTYTRWLSRMHTKIFSAKEFMSARESMMWMDSPAV